MNLDTTTLYIVLGVIAALLILFAILRGRSKPRIERPADTIIREYVASTDRPYVRDRNADGAQGNSLSDEIASAATDVAGQVLEVKAHGALPGAEGLDDFQQMKGVGPKFAARLNELGLTRYDQLARLTENEVARLDAQLGPFKGRLMRDRVVEQAGYLARGDRDGFEERFGKLGGA
jgi:predicted flap endonuclease-1-like 5' DNA nuclease